MWFNGQQPASGAVCRHGGERLQLLQGPGRAPGGQGQRVGEHVAQAADVPELVGDAL